MNGIIRLARTAALCAACATAFPATAAVAQDSHEQERTASALRERMADKARLHGGQVAMTKLHNFEVLFSPDGLRIYGYTMAKAPMMLEGASGKVTLSFKDGAKQEIPLVRRLPAEGEPAVYFCPMHTEVVQAEPGICTKCGSMKLYRQDALYAAADLSKAQIGSLKAVIEIAGFSAKEPRATFPSNFIGFAANPTKLRAKATDPAPPQGEPAHP